MLGLKKNIICKCDTFLCKEGSWEIIFSVKLCVWFLIFLWCVVFKKERKMLPKGYSDFKKLDYFRNQIWLIGYYMVLSLTLGGIDNTITWIYNSSIHVVYEINHIWLSINLNS